MSTPTFEPDVFVDVTREQYLAWLAAGKPSTGPGALPTGAIPITAAGLNRLGQALSIASQVAGEAATAEALASAQSVLQAGINTKVTNAQAQAIAQAAIAAFVGSAPAELDTWPEVVAYLANLAATDSSVAGQLTTLTQQIAAKYTKPSGGIPSADLDPAVLTPYLKTADAAAAYQQVWRPNTTYAQGAVVVSPAGQLVRRKTAGTSGASYDPAMWDAVSSGGLSAASARSMPGMWVGAFNTLPTDQLTLADTGGRTFHTTLTFAVETSNPRLVFPYGLFVRNSTTDVEAPLSNAFPFKASVIINGQVRPVLFNGARAGLTDPRGRMISDPIGGRFPAGTQLKVKVYTSIASGAYYPVSYPAFGPGVTVTGGGYDVGSDTTDTTAGPTTSQGSDAMWVPGLLGHPTATVMHLGAMHDSIGLGTGDSPRANSWITRGVAGTLPLFRAGTGGVAAQGYANAHQTIMPLFAGCTHVLVALGTNDLISRTVAQLQADLATLYRALIAEGVKPIGVTITPRTTSIDGWATLDGQTPTAATGDPYVAGPTSKRAQVNTWIRNGADGLIAGYFEFADVTESARESGLWKATGRRVTDAATTSGSTTITSASANFTSADVGKGIFITGAVTGATTTITAVTNSTTATVSVAATATVSGATAGIGAYGFATDGLHPSIGGHTAAGAALTADLSRLAAL